MKRLLRVLVVLGAIALLCWSQTEAIAATSAAVRSFDDVKVEGNKDFSGKNLVEAEFAGENLEGANFSNADLRGAVFSALSLANTNFQGADFSYGLTYLVEISNADLSDAILEEATMMRTTFKNVKIDGADFTNAILDRGEIPGLCQIATGVNSRTGVATRDSLGCR